MSAAAAAQKAYSSPKSPISRTNHRHNFRDIQRKIIKQDHYLIDLCGKYEWEVVEKCCSFLLKIFQASSFSSPVASSDHTNEARRRGVEQLKATDRWGNTCLHIACHHKPPASVISAILLAASKVPEGPLNLHMMVNSRNATPLITACSTGASRHVIQELLLTPEGLIPGGAAVTIVDDYGNTPFDGLIMRYEMYRKIPTLKDRCKPLEQVAHFSFRNQDSNYSDDIWALVEGSNSSSSDDERDDDEESNPILQSFWFTLEGLIRASYEAHMSSVRNGKNPRTAGGGGGSSSSSTTTTTYPLISMVHGAARVAACLPTKLSDFLLRIQPESVPMADMNGTLPLHLAVMANSIRRQEQHSTNVQLMYQQAHFIQQLLQMDPMAASLPMPAYCKPLSTPSSSSSSTSLQRLPLCQAIESGLQWHIQEPTDLRPIPGPLQMLWEANPDALYVRDAVTGLYPCLLAATIVSDEANTNSNNNNNSNSNNEQDSVSNEKLDGTLDTIFHLLRLYPQVFQELSIM